MNLEHITSTVNLIIALIGLGGFGAAAIWKLRGWVRADMEATVTKHIAPIASSQEAMKADFQTISRMVATHDTALFGQHGYSERLAWLEGRAEARKEIALETSGQQARQDISKGTP